MNSDFKELLQLFNDNAVEYLGIGGYAVIEYAEPRYTKDLDLWVWAEPVNAGVAVVGVERVAIQTDSLALSTARLMNRRSSSKEER